MNEDESPPAWPAPPPPTPTRKLPWILGIIGCILIVASLVASFVQLPYYTISPGDALDVNGLVTVHGAKKYPPKGSVMLLFVEERSRINAWRWLQASLDSEIDLIKQGTFTGHTDPAVVDANDVADMASSKDNARLVALERLGYKVTPEKRVKVFSVIADEPAHGVLEPGDLIDSLGSTKVTSPDQLTAFMRKQHPGEQIAITYSRDGRRHSASVRLGRDPHNHAILGVFLGEPLKFPFDVDIDTSDIGGPSAGLAMTLSTLDELTPGNLTGGKMIAVTGTISPDGTVGEIGGAGQKAVAARHRGAQLFIVPQGNVAEAKSRAGSMRVVGVKTLADALRALRAAGGDPLPKQDSHAAA